MLLDCKNTVKCNNRLQYDMNISIIKRLLRRLGNAGRVAGSAIAIGTNVSVSAHVHCVVTESLLIWKVIIIATFT